MRQNIYDDKKFSDEYDKMRNENSGINANDVIEIPIFRSMLPDLTDKFIFFTTAGNLSGAIMYAIDGEGLEITTNYNGYFADDFKIVSGYLHASGSIFCADEENGVVSDECKGKDLLVKYANNTLIVIPA